MIDFTSNCAGEQLLNLARLCHLLALYPRNNFEKNRAESAKLARELFLVAAKPLVWANRCAGLYRVNQEGDKT